MQLACRRYGYSGEPLIVLHGLFGSRENLHSICLRLQTEFRVYALDQRNHGESPHTVQMDYQSMAEDIREFILTEGLERAHLLGHSMGAKTAMQLALSYPTQVQSLISVDMAPRAYGPRHDKILEGLVALDLGSLQNRQQMEKELEPWVRDLATRRFLLKNARRSATGFYWGMGLKEIAQNYARLSEAVKGAPFDGPALFVRGVQSDYLSEEDLPSIRKLFRKATMRAVPAAGHLLHVENPEVFLQEVLGFLAH